jgi:hypothetical protein
MNYDVSSVTEYIQAIPEDRQPIISHLRDVFGANLPDGFEETIQYKMLTYVIPLSLYPNGYLNKKDTPLPFISIASQKHHIAVYHMGLYMNQEVLSWFEEAYQTRVGHKLDMGKSCIRFKKMDQIPYTLLGELAQKITPEDFIKQYEEAR